MREQVAAHVEAHKDCNTVSDGLREFRYKCTLHVQQTSFSTLPRVGLCDTTHIRINGKEELANPENDLVGVDLESTYSCSYGSDALTCNFPSAFSPGIYQVRYSSFMLRPYHTESGSYRSHLVVF